MGFLGRLFGRGSSSSPAAEGEAAEPAECLHGDLAPRWDNAEQMGKNEFISSYTCNSCGTTFSTDEGEQIKQNAGSRIKETLGE